MDVTSNPVPISRNNSSRVTVPGVRATFQFDGLGPLETPRAAFAVEAIPNLRALAKSNVQPCNTPSRTISRRWVAKPSASNSRDPEMRGLCGSSTTDRCDGNTCLPKSAINHDDPRAIAAPFTADNKCPIKLDEMRSSNTTG